MHHSMRRLQGSDRLRVNIREANLSIPYIFGVMGEPEFTERKSISQATETLASTPLVYP